MGEFSKNQASNPKSEKKKIMIAGSLGAVLVVMGLFHVLKPGPQTAEAAAAPSGGGDAIVPTISPEQARASLSDDPTTELLRATKTVDTTLQDVPTNPFVMSPVWRKNLVKTVAQTHTTGPVITHTQGPSTPMLSLTEDKFKLTGIFRQGQKLYAIINGEIVSTGTTVGDGRVVLITTDHVALQHVDSPDGPHLVLTINPQMK